jgi:Diacylglycerol acyltransferase
MTVHCVSPERTPTEHHVCDEGSKPKAVVVIDKSGSLPPTLEHHLAIHLWMGWIGLYVLLATSVVVGTISLSLFRLSSGSIPHTLLSTSGGDCQSKSAMVSIHNNTHYPSYTSSCCRHASSGTVPATAHIMSNSHMSSSSLMFLAIYYLELSTAICCLLSLLAVLISALAPLNKHGSPNPKWCLSIGNWIMTMGAEYFKLKVVLEDYDAMRLSAETGKPAIFVLEPHDVLPVSIFSLCDFLGALPGKRRLIGCISSACFKVPLMRHVWSWVCAESIDRKNVVRLLKGGVSVCLCPGGVREVIEMSRQQQKKSNRLNSKASKKSGYSIASTADNSSSSSSKTTLIPSVSDGDLQTELIADTTKSSINTVDTETEVFEEECVLYLRERKGFVRLALQHGCPLVPMFTFGQREVLEPWFCTNR